ncbi:hypothetical protein FB451DRAFT_1409151 [Mycena latifolia]|nr:hypothetical protein FB451DRAFT_1409151 [Mycena latifolia]
MKTGRSADPGFSADWVSNLKLLAAGLKTTSACVPVPCLQPVFEGVGLVLDLAEKVGKNEADLKYLAECAINIISLLTDELKSRPNSPDVRLVNLCTDFVRYLDKAANEFRKPKSKFWFKKYLQAKSIRDNLDEFTRRLADLRADLTLAAAVGSRFQIVDTDRRVQDLQVSIEHITREILSPAATGTELSKRHDPFLDAIEEDVLVFKPSELHLDFGTVYLSAVSLRGQSACLNQVTVRTYAAKVGHASVATARVNRFNSTPQMWKRDLKMFAAHLRIPGIAQIYGMCKSPRLQALIFHDELVPIDIYAASIISPIQSADFELNLIRNFMSVFSHIATVLGVLDPDYRETVADLTLISRSTGSLVISHLPYSTGTTVTEDPLLAEKQVGGPVHSWFSSCGCLAQVPPDTPEHTKAVISLSLGNVSSLESCSTMGSLSRYRALSCKGSNLENLKLGSIYLQRPDDLEIVHRIAEVAVPNPEIVIEDWTTLKGTFKVLPDGWTR